jgi:hypothetical protein
VDGAVGDVAVAAGGRAGGEELDEEAEEVVAALGVGEEAQGVVVVAELRAKVGEWVGDGGEGGARGVEGGEDEDLGPDGGRGVDEEGRLPGAHAAGQLDAHVEAAVDGDVEGTQRAEGACGGGLEEVVEVDWPVEDGAAWGMEDAQDEGRHSGILCREGAGVVAWGGCDL